MELMLREEPHVVRRIASQMRVGWWRQGTTMDASGAIFNEDDLDRDLKQIKKGPCAGVKRALSIGVPPHLMPSDETFRPLAVRPSSETVTDFFNKWCAFVERAVSRYSPDLLIVFPEWSDGVAWGVTDKTGLVTDYVRLLSETYGVAHGKTQVGIGGFFLGPTPLWWPELMQAGALDYADAVTLHPYSHYRDLPFVVDFQERQIADMAAMAPVYITEMGLPTVADPTSRLKGRQPETTPDGSGAVDPLSETEAARWWTVLLDMYEVYAVTAQADIAGPKATDHWGTRIAIGEWPLVMDVFKQHFPL